MNQFAEIFSSMTPQMKLGVVFFFFLGVVVVTMTQRLIRSSGQERMAAILQSKQVGVSEKAASAILSAERQVSKGGGRSVKRPFDLINPKSISRDMKNAGLPGLPPLVFLVAGFLAFLVARFIVNAPIYPLHVQALALFPPMYFLVRRAILGTMIESRKMKARIQLIAFIESVQRAVSVGASPDEAVAEAIMDTEKPLRDTLMSVKELLDLGFDFIEAINLAAEQIDLAEFDIFAASLTAQASTGGTIGNVLRDVVEIARSRTDLTKKVATMTAEGRFNAILLGSLPIGLTQYLRAKEPDYFNQLWESATLGPALYFGTLALAVMGAFLAMRIARITV